MNDHFIYPGDEWSFRMADSTWVKGTVVDRHANAIMVRVERVGSDGYIWVLNTAHILYARPLADTR